MVDRGCNSGFLGRCSCLNIKENAFADIVGMNDNVVNQAPIGTGCLKITTNQGPIIAIFHQYALGGKGHTIHSALQMEAFGLVVEDKSQLLPGTPSQQAIITPEGYEIPLSIQGGLPYFDSCKPTEKDLEIYPAIFMTADMEWDPTIFDNTHEPIIKEQFVNQEDSDIFIDHGSQNLDIHATEWQSQDVDLGDMYVYDDPNLYNCIRYAHLHAKDKLSCGPMLNLFKPHKISPKDPDYENSGLILHGCLPKQ